MSLYRVVVRIEVEAPSVGEADMEIQAALEAVLLRDDSPLRSFTILPGIEELL